MTKAPAPLEQMAAHALHSAFKTNKDITLPQCPNNGTVPRGTILAVDYVLLSPSEVFYEPFEIKLAIRFDPESAGSRSDADSPHWFFPVHFLVDDCEVLNPN